MEHTPTPKARRFTAPKDGILSTDMLTAWKEDGFLVLESFVDIEACESLRAHAKKMVDAFEPVEVASIFSTGDQSHKADTYFQESGDRISFFFEPEAFLADGSLRQDKTLSINKIGHAMHDLDPVFDRFSRTRALANVADGIGIQDPKIMQSMYIFKQPFIGGEVTSHQDSSFLYTDPLSCVGFWFAIEDATEENGAMYAIPGGHSSPLTQRFHYESVAPDAKLVMSQQNEPAWNEADRVLLDAPQGTLVLLHGSLPHYSGANRSAKSRHAYTLHAVDGKTKWLSDNWIKRKPSLALSGFEPKS